MKHPTLLATVCLVLVAAGALAVRLPQLDRRPMHADEANQAVKAGELWETGTYDYDPQEHHGPTLYWLTLPSLWLRGAGDFADTTEADYRIVPVVFGVGLILLLVLVADGLGRPAAVLAGVFAALSPAMVYYSRYYVQETLLVFFTLGAIACAWRYVRSRAAGWAVAAGAFVGLMHATKETWVLAGAAAAVGLPLSITWTRLRDGTLPELRAHLRPLPLLAAVVAACAVAVAFYSSFGADWHGPLDSLLAYQTYLLRGTEAGGQDQPWYDYLQRLLYNRPAKRLFWSEGLIVGLAAVGSVFALALRQPADAGTSPLPSAGEGSGVRAVETTGGVTAREHTPGPSGSAPSLPFVRFLAFFTFTLTALYAAIPYKTPWCLLGFLDGMTLLAGFGAWAILRTVPTWPLKLVVAGLLAAGLVQLNGQRVVLNGLFCADARNPYAHVQCTNEMVDFGALAERLAAASPEGHEMMIHVVTPENYWPIPWYLRRFNPDHVGYWRDVETWARETAALPPPSVIIFTSELEANVDAHLPGAYNQQPIFGLRPGVKVQLYTREEVWDAFAEAASRK